jgi:Fe2+ or Zn2+ uptake regulation protein
MILIRKTVLWFLIENKGKEIAVADIIEYLNSKQIYLGAKTLYNNYLSFYIRKGLITQIKNWGLMNYRFKVNKWENE